MSATGTIQQITFDELLYAPAALVAVLAAEQSNASGASKLQAVVNGIMAGSAALAGTAGVSPTVAGISALVNLTVSILNALGVFTHKSAATPAP